MHKLIDKSQAHGNAYIINLITMRLGLHREKGRRKQTKTSP